MRIPYWPKYIKYVEDLTIKIHKVNDTKLRDRLCTLQYLTQISSLNFTSLNHKKTANRDIYGISVYFNHLVSVQSPRIDFDEYTEVDTSKCQSLALGMKYLFCLSTLSLTFRNCNRITDGCLDILSRRLNRRLCIPILGFKGCNKLTLISIVSLSMMLTCYLITYHQIQGEKV